jgi:hypothetical protein
VQLRSALRRPSAIAAALALMASAFAGPAVSQQAATPPAALNQNPTPGQLSLARDLVISSGVARSFESLIPQYMDQIRNGLSSTRPEIVNDLNQVLAALKPEFEGQREEMLGIASRVYAQRLSEPDLKDSVAFFKSQAGQAYVAAQPQMLDDLFREMQGWTQRLSEFMVTRIRAEMKKKGHEI